MCCCAWVAQPPLDSSNIYISLIDEVIVPEPCPADFTGYGVINTSDLLVFVSLYGSSCGSPFCVGDLTGDGNVNTSDLLVFVTAYGTSCP